MAPKIEKARWDFGIEGAKQLDEVGVEAEIALLLVRPIFRRFYEYWFAGQSPGFGSLKLLF